MSTRRSWIIGGAAAALGLGGAAWFERRRMGSDADYAAATTAMRAPLRDPADPRELVRFATLAASGHNAQPWRFRIDARAIAILPDFARRTPVVDPDDHHLWASLGCAAANLEIAAAARGRTGAVRFDGADGGALVFDFDPALGAAAPEPMLVEAIPRRRSSRSDYDSRPVPAADLGRMVAAAATPGVDVAILTERAALERVRDLVVAGNDAQMADPAFVRELRDWIRFAPSQALAAGDGLFAASSGNPTLPDWLGPTMFDLVFRAASENEKNARWATASAGVAIFVAKSDGPEHWAEAGRACQRFALAATALGVRCAFLNQPLEVARLRPEVASLVGLPGRRPNLLLRFGYGPELPLSPRRPVAEVIEA